MYSQFYIEAIFYDNHTFFVTGRATYSIVNDTHNRATNTQSK